MSQDPSWDELAKMHEEFQERMETKYPKMFSKPYGGMAIGAGWFDLVETLCSLIQGRIDSRYKQHTYSVTNNLKIVPATKQVVVAQVKEKFGGLRFYYDGGDEYIAGLVDMTETMSYNICEECGDRGERRGGGWIQTLCDKHEAERQERIAKRSKEA